MHHTRISKHALTTQPSSSYIKQFSACLVMLTWGEFETRRTQSAGAPCDQRSVVGSPKRVVILAICRSSEKNGPATLKRGRARSVCTHGIAMAGPFFSLDPSLLVHRRRRGKHFAAEPGNVEEIAIDVV